MKPVVEAARHRLAEGREQIREQHLRGSPGIQLGTKISDLCDEVVLEIFEAALADLGDSQLHRDVTLVAHGGYGRRDMAPFSDVDLMLLHAEGIDTRVEPLARKISQDLVDSGFNLGFSIRRRKEAVKLAMKDASVLTAMSESRWLAGSQGRFDRFMNRLRRESRRRVGSMLQNIGKARQEERQQFGETVHLLRPNVKRSRGGLRDIQLVRWIGFVLYGTTDPTQLEQMGGLIQDERRTLRKSLEFLLRLRNELHFHAGKAQDVLEKTEQVRLATAYGYQESEGLLPVEQFMRDYFEHTSNVRYISSNFLKTAKGRSSIALFFGNLFGRAEGREYRVGPRHIRATPYGLQKLKGDFAEILRLMNLANLLDKRIDHDTWQAIRLDMMKQAEVHLTPEAIQAFLSLLSQPTQLATLLYRLHELRVLEHLVPPMAHARSLLQFNEYHKYTIDEHCIHAIRKVTEMSDDDTVIGEIYRELGNKRTLHLALLLHDLGKGFPDDHSVVGGRLTEETGHHLQMSVREIELMRFLVEKHLRMAHLAFRHDLTDRQVILEFAAEVGSLERLRLLLLLTCADIAAVGPGVLNKWKKDLIIELYERTRAQLSGDTPLTVLSYEAAKKNLHSLVTGRASEAWFRDQIDCLPQGFLSEGNEQEVLEMLERLETLKPGSAIAWGRYNEERHAVEYTIGTHEDTKRGLFHRITGALTSKRLSILSAEINTLANGLVLDRFNTQDLDFTWPPPETRLDEVSQSVVKALTSGTEPAPQFTAIWGANEGLDAVEHLPAQVRLDNSTSESYTIVTIFSYDRLGLLYAIARALYKLQLSVSVAKVSTNLDQIVDVFYVTDQNGDKVEDEQRLLDIRETLTKSIESKLQTSN
jgi:[protein-PII] uridylyltransferase